MTRKNILAILILLPLLAGRAMGGEAPAAQPAALTVAVLDFDSAAAGDAELGKQITSILTALLGGEEGFTLVDRPTLTRAMQELELNQSGLVGQNATKLGSLVGARILITGRAFVLDKSLYLTARITGTETSLVEAIMVKADQNAEMGALVMQLAEKLALRIRGGGQRLVAGAASDDPLPGLIAKLKDRKLPKLAVSVTEQHHASLPSQRVIDPAAETEIRLILKQAGFAIAEGGDKDLARAGVQQVVSGEAFSEFAARIGNLVSCSARIEVKIKPLNGETILFTDRETVRAVDLSENIAAKLALQKAGRRVSLRILEHFIKQESTK